MMAATVFERSLRGIKRFSSANSNAAAITKNLAVRVGLLMLNFGTGVIVARSLGPMGRGEQTAIAMWPSLLAALFTFGVPTALNFHSRRRPEDAHRLYMASVAALFAIALLVGIGGAFAMPLLLHGYSAETIRAAQWFMFFAPEVLVASAARAYLESQDQFTRSALGVFYPTIVTLLALCALRVSGHFTPVSSALCYAIPQTLQAVWLITRLWRWESFVPERLGEDLARLLPFGLKCYSIDVLNALSGQMDLVVIVAFLSATELGLYTVALSLCRVLNIVHSSVVTILFSRASAMESDEVVDLVGRAGRLSTLVALSLGAVMVVVSYFAVPVVYGPRFVSVLPVLAIMTVEALLGGVATIHYQTFMATGRPHIVTGIQILWTSTAIGLLCVLVTRMNLIGAAVALVTAASLRIVCILAAYPIVMKRPIPRLLIERSDISYIRGVLRKIGLRQASC